MWPADPSLWRRVGLVHLYVQNSTRGHPQGTGSVFYMYIAG